MGTFERVWEEFSSERVLDFGGHTDTTWNQDHNVSACLTLPVDDEGFRDRLTPLRDALRPFPFVSLHPDHFLHITLAKIGFPVEEPKREGEVSWESLKETEKELREALSGVEPLEMKLANLNAFPAAAFVEAHEARGDADGISALTQRLGGVSGLGRISDIPHLTLAYFHALEGSRAPDELIRAIARYRDWPVAKITAREVQLSLLDLESGYPHPEEMARIRLT